ncbi:pyridoxal-phosphate dependent enzyme [Paraliomyxa miuraensis]|uniref:pyridoxal-phosphate dependent enzyme n=1 Tax=Paraliomyxa miuraensis TaxID=376150 RepID=UPI00225AAF36|nr:pyridoxal-phosphate dependent enzyme [Paraliomyxa miuraensis]MCX4241038.1 pyridoxal-phosphate dependent enzyme [Paraliomyxa miuraensis]
MSQRLGAPPARLTLAKLPTPVERVPGLDVGGAEVWVKRDDVSSDVYGGGKVRKLEWVLANAPYDGDGPILSVGGVGSHHLLALALFLRQQGRSLHALTFTQTLTPHVRRNLAVLVSCGARLWNVKSRARLPWAWLAYHVWRRPERMGVSMPAGASTALGCLGFVEAGLELSAQIDAGLLPLPRVVFVTAGSAGTSAGLALGLALAGRSMRLHLVSSVERWGFNGVMFRRMLGMAHRVMVQHGLPASQAKGSAGQLLEHAGVTWCIDHSQVGGGYGVPTDAATQAMEDARAQGLRLETTYTAKCVAGMRRALAEHPVEGPVLFWNTHASNDLRAHVREGWQADCPFAP